MTAIKLSSDCDPVDHDELVEGVREKVHIRPFEEIVNVELKIKPSAIVITGYETVTTNTLE